MDNKRTNRKPIDNSLTMSIKYQIKKPYNQYLNSIDELLLRKPDCDNSITTRKDPICFLSDTTININSKIILGNQIKKIHVTSQEDDIIPTHLYEFGFLLPDKEISDKTYYGIIRLHRPIPEHSSFLITQDKNGKWYIVIKYKIIPPKTRLQYNQYTKTIGIDVGIRQLAVLSDGTVIENHRTYMEYEDKLASLMANKDTSIDTKEIALLEKQIIQLQIKIRDIRKNYLHHISKDIVENSNYDIIFVEDIDIKSILKNTNGSEAKKKINDVGWGILLKMLEYKCKKAGKQFFKVRANGTSKICSKCGHYFTQLSHSDTIFNCPNCKAIIDRDLNAAININNRGIQKVREIIQRNSSLSK